MRLVRSESSEVHYHLKVILVELVELHIAIDRVVFLFLFLCLVMVLSTRKLVDTAHFIVTSLTSGTHKASGRKLGVLLIEW